MKITRALFCSPVSQRQVNLPRSSRHVPSLKHGLDAHSFTSTSQRDDVNPGAQAHRNDPGVLTHVPPNSHGDLTAAHAHKAVHYLTVHQSFLTQVTFSLFSNDKTREQKDVHFTIKNTLTGCTFINIFFTVRPGPACGTCAYVRSVYR